MKSAIQNLPKNFEQLVEDMNLCMASKLFAHNICLELVFIMDETFIWYILVGSTSTYDNKNAEQVQVH